MTRVTALVLLALSLGPAASFASATAEPGREATAMAATGGAIAGAEPTSAAPPAADTASPAPAATATPAETPAPTEAASVEAVSPGASVGAAAFRLVLGLAGVGLAMAGSLGAYRWLLRRRPGSRRAGRERRLRPQVVSRTYLGAKESLCVVEVGRDRFLIATGPTGIACLGRLDGADPLDEPDEPRASDFARALGRMTAQAPAPAPKVPEPDETEVLAALGRTRDRLARLVGTSAGGRRA